MDWIYNIQRFASLTSSECRGIAIISSIIIVGSCFDIVLSSSPGPGAQFQSNLIWEDRIDSHTPSRDTVRVDSTKGNVESLDPKPDVAAKFRVNINHARASELIKLKGIGPSLAARILSYREENGPFKSVDQIVKVKGIGAGKLEMIRTQITIESID